MGYAQAGEQRNRWTIRASLPFPLDETLIFYIIFFNRCNQRALKINSKLSQNCLDSLIEVNYCCSHMQTSFTYMRELNAR